MSVPGTAYRKQSLTNLAYPADGTVYVFVVWFPQFDVGRPYIWVILL